MRVPQQRERVHIPRRGVELRGEDGQGQQDTVQVLLDQDRTQYSWCHVDFQMKIIGYIDEKLIKSMQN